jgi:PAS domain S-box-containing protein
MTNDAARIPLTATTLESSDDEVTRLRCCLNDLVSIVALPALSIGGEPAHIVSTLQDVLLRMLPLAFVFVRLKSLEGGASIEMARVTESLEGTTAREIGEAIDSSLGDESQRWAQGVRIFIGDVDLSVASARLGRQGEIGLVVGSQRLDFPAETDRLLLEAAANQATIGLQQARLLSELATAKEALRENERNSHLVVDSIPGLVGLLTTDGDVQFVNRQILEYTGQTLQELKQWGTNGTVHPQDLPHVIQVFTQSITSGRPYEIVQRLRRSDGVYRWFQNNGFPLRDAGGHIVSWCVLLTDIDERKRAEEELRHSEAFLAQAQRLTLTGSLWWEVSSGEVIWSDEAYRIMEMPKSTKPTVEMALRRIHLEDLDLAREMVERSARDGVNMDFEPRLLMPDGSVKHVHVVLQNIGRQPGKPEFVGAVTDITERKRAEAELRRAYDHLTEAQRLSQTGSFTADLERDEHYWSDEFYRICEFEPGSTVTIQRLGDIVHPEDVPLYEGAIGRAMAGTDPDFYFRIVTSRGVVKHLRGFAHRITDRPVFVGAVQDVTASKMAQEALNRARSELAHVARVTTVSALTASIAHEVNQPLSGIITNAGTCLRMLAADPPDIDGARETARRTIRDGNRASDVITRLRALFSKKEFTLEPLDLNEATREVIALSSNDLQRNRVILQSELTDDLPTITGDRIQLQQVILNLLRNASDAMVDIHDRPRQLLIRTEREDGDRVRVTVRDAGVGVDRQNMDKLFNPFYTTKSGGMGIGLSVSRSIVERHQGRLWAQLNDGPGTTFSFSIPRGPESVSNARDLLL